MSVPISQRKESKMEVHMACDRLVEHTLTKLENARRFGDVITEEVWLDVDTLEPCETTRTFSTHRRLADRIEEAAVMCGECAWRANDIRVSKTGRGYAERRDLQEQAIRHATALIWLIRLTRTHCGQSGNQVKHWTDLATHARSLLRKWRDSDAERFAGLPDSGMRGW